MHEGFSKVVNGMTSSRWRLDQLLVWHPSCIVAAADATPACIICNIASADAAVNSGSADDVNKERHLVEHRSCTHYLQHCPWGSAPSSKCAIARPHLLKLNFFELRFELPDVTPRTGGLGCPSTYDMISEG